ncbi:UDP-glucose 4-epimerase GalE [Arthrobacter russicus]|jgi:UDP-glucose 4-epimerase|uniref:UDP-glucose 4-epimerase n=1 Tax=Arthrobacter russicus TaxID=172040 RepID=A0ABU1JB77_9MICC|nr:UDP-glucose 4-epimerase GalE [Arthrobacter russicus]MDR6269399.1 UDP-glucose 4-epimerase [Arthrobacter russicus]
MKIMVTGGAGYIGSHTAVGLLQDGHELVIVDNLANSSAEAVQRVQEISGRPVGFRELDLLDEVALSTVFAQERPQAVIHFAGLKSVGESVSDPLRYYRNNLIGTLNLLASMAEHQVRTLVFSSSATVYSADEPSPLAESASLAPVNPYGRTKQQIEEALADLGAADPSWRIAMLRYFNPVGAHPSGRIGEDPAGVPNNLLPYVAQVAIGRQAKVTVHGADYATPDGTGVRDYVHVMDLAQGHIAALDFLDRHRGVFRWNLGTGKGHSVLEVIDNFAAASGREIPFEIGARRPGDVAVSIARPAAAQEQLGWVAERGIAEMCRDHWRWQENNPRGFAG